MKPQTILRLPQVKQRTGLSRSTVYALVKSGDLKKPISLGARAVGWLESDVDEFIAARTTASRGQHNKSIGVQANKGSATSAKSITTPDRAPLSSNFSIHLHFRLGLPACYLADIEYSESRARRYGAELQTPQFETKFSVVFTKIIMPDRGALAGPADETVYLTAMMVLLREVGLGNIEVGQSGVVVIPPPGKTPFVLNKNSEGDND